MLFNSYVFIFIFFPSTLLLYYIIRNKLGHEGSFILLVVASLIYYGYWKYSYLLILLSSIAVNYALGLWLSRALLNRKLILIAGITLNLSTLAYYKYADFILQNLQSFSDSQYSSLDIILPLAISFFTFQQIAFLVDTYQNKAREYSFTHYCLFISFFPQLIAGPIVHHKEMLPQFMDKTRALFDQNMFWHGVQQFCLGLAKKVIIADNVALYASPVFIAADQGQPIGFTDAWIAILAYTFQIYFDFSAYSDMAIGIGKMFGINLPKNFNSPYKAKSISDFWRRWHMTLSRFLRDYLYITLGGNRNGSIQRYRNLLLTMILGGLWHGASWNFVLWGTLHGLYLSINHAWQKMTKVFIGKKNNQIYAVIAQVLTFFSVIMAWVLFRAETFDGAMSIYAAASQVSSFSWAELVNARLMIIADPIKAIITILTCSVIAFFLPNSQDFIEGMSESISVSNRQILIKGLPIAIAAGSSAILILSISSMNKVSEFLYFQF